MGGKVYRNTLRSPRGGRGAGPPAGLRLDTRAARPLYLQIAAGLEADIRSGRRTPGTRLPSTRRLAGALGVSLVTVVNAYRELMRHGLAGGEVGRGTFVRAPAPAAAAAPGPGEAGAEGPGASAIGPVAPDWPGGHAGTLGAEAEPPGPGWDPSGVAPSRAVVFQSPLGKQVIGLHSGLPGTDFLPLALFRRAVEEVMARDGTAALQYAPIEGYAPLREVVAEYLRGGGMRVEAGDLIVCSGAVTGIHLAARLVTRPGEVVLTETPSYCFCLSALESLSVRLVGVPGDREGMRVDVAERLVRQYRPRAIYTTPTYNNPTGLCLSAARRQALLALAQREGLTIIEEDYANEIGFRGRPPQSLKSMDADGRVLYVKSFSKLVCPSIRVAVIAAPARAVPGLLAAKEGIDPWGSGFHQRVLHRMLAQPEFAASLGDLGEKYRPRRDAMCGALRDLGGHDLAWVDPEGGAHVWVRLPGALDSRDLLRQAVEAGVSFAPGPSFVPDRQGADYMRLSFGNVTPDQIRAGVARLVRVVRRRLDRQRRRPADARLSAGALV